MAPPYDKLYWGRSRCGHYTFVLWFLLVSSSSSVFFLA